jgi:hypothetical protein
MRKFSSGNEGGDSKRKGKADQEKEKAGKMEFLLRLEIE